MAHQWTRIVMKGRAQVIPTVCPNCLRDADQKTRYGFKGIEGWLTRTTYYQTFIYCQQCLPQATSAMGLRKWGIFGAVMAFVSFFPFMIIFLDLLKDPGIGVTGTNTIVTLGTAAASLPSLGIGVLVYWVARTIKRRRHPLLPGQIVWGPAAFYTGSAWMGLSSDTATYKAARPEWIAALLKANPEQVDDAIYQTMTGAARPAAPTDSRPFGPT